MMFISLNEISLLVFNYLGMNKYIINFKNNKYFLTHHHYNNKLKYNDMLRIFKPDYLIPTWGMISIANAKEYKSSFQEYFNFPFQNDNLLISFSTLQEAEDFQDKLNACLVLRKLSKNGLGNS